MSEEILTYRALLKNNLLHLGKSPDNEIDQLVRLFNEIKIPKKTSIIKPSEKNENVYFIIHGIVRIYYVKENKEITNWFITENRFFAPVYHLFTGNPNPNYYEALEDTTAIMVPYDQMEKLYHKYHSLEHIGRKLIELYYAEFLKQSYDLMFLSAEERYSSFIKKTPELVNRIPLRYIASFLGITQETLSRLRSKH